MVASLNLVMGVSLAAEVPRSRYSMDLSSLPFARAK
jgi:hypothetical protein